MSHPGTPEHGQEQQGADTQDPLRRFRNWQGFLAAAMAVNALFAYGIAGQMGDPATVTWHKTLIWLPFNAIATVVYYAIMIKLSRPGPAGLFYKSLCGALIVGNWLLMLKA